MIEGVFLQTRKFCPKHTMQIGNGVDMKTKSAQGCRHHHRRSQSRLPLIIHVLMNPPKKNNFFNQIFGGSTCLHESNF